MSESEDSKIREALESFLDCARGALAEADLGLQVVTAGPDLYSMEMSGTAEPLGRFPAGVQGICFPVTTGENAAKSLVPWKAGQSLVFPGVSLVSLTGFVALKLTASMNGRSMGTSFVLKLPVRGMPEGRDTRILRAIISDEGRFVRYLLFLLADVGDASLFGRVLAIENGSAGDGTPLRQDLPLLEELVRAFARSPERLTRIGRLVDDLRESEEGLAVLPEGFERVWNALMAARSKESGK